MKVCVLDHPRIRSEEHFNDIANTPLWSCLMGGYAAASLAQAGFAPTYWDATRTKWDFAETADRILGLAPDLLCVNAVYIWEHTSALFTFLANLKEKGFAGHINLFGFFPSLAWQPVLEEDRAVDSVAVGEYESILVELAERLARKENLSDIPGLAVLQEGKRAVLTKRSPAGDPDSFPQPWRRYDDGETVSILASRGCYNQCRFCPIPSFYNDGPLWTGRTPENVYAEIAELAEAGCRDFYFVDPNFIGPGKKGRQRTLHLLELLRPLQIRFGMETRPNDLDGEILESLRSAGCTSLLLGIESGSPSMLSSLDKYSSRSAGERAIRLCRLAGIEPEVGFLMFVPDSTLADLQQNLAFLRDNDLLDRLDRTANLLSHYQIVLRGTSGYQRFLDQGRLTPRGMFGFEGDVAFADQSVQWISGLVIVACQKVLREMEKEDSPIYWQKRTTTLLHNQLNAFLVDLFAELLQLAGEKDSFPPAPGVRQKITEDIEMMLRRGTGT